MQWIIRLVINAIALWVVAEFVPGIDFTDGSVVSILLVALVFGLVNAFIKPIVRLLSLPVRIITLGLFGIVINAAMLGITAAIMDQLTIDGIMPALIGAVVISIVSAVLGMLVPDKE
ncbi:MAG: phage holin family protein [Acidimicrobiia bacterium]|nr:phage holin family protein [Acidimicrobiia bacterium]MDH4308141.1 phage holin family protein [Acidimicrobiia bacterium]MDH5295124.1 phage holin family protein [Acidimicrobiia bacterium]